MTSQKQELIEVKRLSKSYQMGHGTVHAIKDVDLKIGRGESVAIMGASGSGKSTLLHLLGCLDTPSEGEYHLDQENVSHLNDSQLASLRSTKIGFVFQSFNLIPQLTVYENVEVPFLYHECPPEEVKKRIENSLYRVGLSHRMYHKPNELSGGEMQRVAIARALSINPVLLLADEPTGNLDSETGKSILNLFTSLNVQGVTLIIVTHDKSVGDHCQRLVKMQDGKVISDERKLS